MKTHRLGFFAVTLGLVSLLAVAAHSLTQEPVQGMDILARGPVHEAFAQPPDVQPQPGPVVPKRPPEPIEEMPPDQMPEGDNVEWISGYWAFDDDSSDFIWVSGCWRAIPPGHQWCPGHWQEVDQGWVWCPGFWAQANAQEVEYLPSPPPTLDTGPTSPAPDANSFYAPGCWVYQENRYLWRPGQWLAFQPDWVWMPAHYIWSPAGCIFVENFWDHPLEERGLLFAPVHFDLAVWAGARRSYIPSYGVHTDFLIGSLFVNTQTHHYCFGDYFENQYAKRGYVPWTDYHPAKGVLDPNFNYYHHLHASEPKWEPSLRELYRARRDGEVPRPPHTLTQQTQVIQNIKVNNKTNVNVHQNLNITHLQNASAIAPIKEIHNTKVTYLNPQAGSKETKESKVHTPVVKIAPVPKDRHDIEKKMVQQQQQAAKQRHDVETQMHGNGKVPIQHNDPAAHAKVTLPNRPAPSSAPPPQIRKAPAAVSLPKHEQKDIPKYQPPHQPGPPKQKEKKDKDKKG